MEEINAYQKLIEYSKKHGYEFKNDENDKRFVLSPNDPTASSKFISFKTIDNCWFLAKDSYAAKANSTSIFTGIYTTINLDKALTAKIRKKNFLDSVFVWNKKKTGIISVDNKLTISCNQKTFPNKLISDTELNLFEEINTVVKPVFIVIENNYLPFLHVLKDQMLIGIETNDWIYKENELDILLTKGVKLLLNIKKNAEI